MKQSVIMKLSLLYLEICGSSAGDRVRIGLKYIQTVRRLDTPSHSFCIEIQGEEMRFRCDNDKTRDFWIKVIRYYSDVIKAVQSINKASMDIRNLKNIDFVKLGRVLEFSSETLRENKQFCGFLRDALRQKSEQKDPVLVNCDFLKKVEDAGAFFEEMFVFLEDYFMVLNVGKFDSKLVVEFPKTIEQFLFQSVLRLRQRNANIPKSKFKK